MEPIEAIFTGLSYVPLISRRIGRWWIKREDYSRRIQVLSQKIMTEVGHARPYLVFYFKISSKVPHDYPENRLAN